MNSLAKAWTSANSWRRDQGDAVYLTHDLPFLSLRPVSHPLLDFGPVPDAPRSQLSQRLGERGVAAGDDIDALAAESHQTGDLIHAHQFGHFEEAIDPRVGRQRDLLTISNTPSSQP